MGSNNLYTTNYNVYKNILCGRYYRNAHTKKQHPKLFQDPATPVGMNQSEYWRSKSTVPSVTTSLTLLGLVAPIE